MRLQLIRTLTALVSSESDDRSDTLIGSVRHAVLEIKSNQRSLNLLSNAQLSMMDSVMNDLDAIVEDQTCAGEYFRFDSRSELAPRLERNSSTLLMQLCETPLVYAIRSLDSDNAAHLINSGVNVNAADSDGMTPLCHACEMQSLNLVQQLVNAGAAVHHETLLGHRPVELAYWHGEENMGSYSEASISIVDYLVTKGSPKNNLT